MFELWIGLTIGNFIWKGMEALFTGGGYELGDALKISFFQGVALFLAATLI